MSQLIQLRQRIFSIKKTCKITHAMRLMSMSMYNKLEKQSVAISRYRKQITSLFSELSRYAVEWQNPILFPEDILDKRPLVIIVSSAKGLCGGFNAHLNRYFDETFSLEEHQTPTFFVVGNKARTFLLKKKFTVAQHFEDFSSATLVDIVEGIIEAINNASEPYSSATIFANSCKNFFVQVPSKKTLLPLPIRLATEGEENLETNTKQDAQASYIFEREPIWEQSKEEVMNFVGTTFLKSLLLNTLLDSLLAEQSARFIAMDHSTTNAQKYLDRLNLLYNKSRQALITSEVAELSAGFSQAKM